MKKRDPRSLLRQAQKNLEASQARFEAERENPQPGGKKSRGRRFEEEAPKDARYEGAESLFKEMKKKDRP